MKTLAILPFRTPSPKHHWLVQGQPLYSYPLLLLNYIEGEKFVYTNDAEIRSKAKMLGIRTEVRSILSDQPEEQLTNTIEEATWQYSPDTICLLLQGTYPFMDLSQIQYLTTWLVNEQMSNGPHLSAQLVCRVPHYFHSANQRLKNGQFAFPEERETVSLNKADKERRYAFAGAVAFPLSCLRQQETFFPHPSKQFIVSRKQGYDVDTLEDLEVING